MILYALAFLHGGQPHNWHELARAWSFEPLVVTSLILSAAMFLLGLYRLEREAPQQTVVTQHEVLSFAGGWVALFVGLVSPVHAWGQVLFSAHMTQHEILMLVAAPLLVLGRPLIVFLWALPLNWSRGIGRVGKWSSIRGPWKILTIPIVAWSVHTLALWIWHVPVLFEAARNESVHIAQHLCFLVSALLFWWAIIHGPRGKMGYGAAVLYLFTTSIHSGILGALITFAGSVWYPSYIGTTSSWGLSPLEDQQLGGLIMWIPAGLIYVIAALALFTGWLRESEIRSMKSVGAWMSSLR